MASILEILRERGFVQQCTGEEGLAKLLASKSVTFYCGFDPTADSLHCGSLMPIMAMAHLQKAGHKPIAIIGGGTAMVGDPSGKTEMRKMLSPDDIERNGKGILGQLQRYLTLDGEAGRFVNNADWLMPLRYIDFLREVGRHFKVNEMIRAEAYRQRLEREEGLSFIEFNYQLLQAYDFLLLHQKFGCELQIGGDDQWSNILAGTDLIRKFESKQAYGLTFPLLTTARGEKMGKTASGAIWLSAERTSPYQFFQYWRNSDDADVPRFLAYFTFLPMEEVRRLSALKDKEINEAKKVLAFEATRLCHGNEAAEAAKKDAEGLFSDGAADLSAVPTTTLDRAALGAGIGIMDLLVKTGLAESKKAARRLIEQGGAYVNNEAVGDINAVLAIDAFGTDGVLLRQGKKKYHRVVVKQ
jgi:tyrosyl-tRNA synthetase